jgi:peroxiredoxin Q/BCP
MSKLIEGQKAPQFILPGSTGGNINFKDYRTKNIVVLYFYPKDMTSGCIREACSFRDLSSEFEAAGAVILGVSTDDMNSHAGFAQAHRLNFPLLSDVDARVSSAYGVYVEQGRYRHTFMGIERTTFVIDKSGTIRKIYIHINVDRHADEVLEFVRGLE